MYPKEVRVAELGPAILKWEGQWKKMMDEQPKEANMPQMWNMAALMEMCPKEIKNTVEKYVAMRENVMTWAVNKAEEG